MGYTQASTGNPASGIWFVVALLAVASVLGLFLKQQKVAPLLPMKSTNMISQ